jgi:hypothetical protein
MKKCINGIMREMTAEEIKEQNEVVEPIQEEKTSLEERIEKLEKLLKGLGGISL